MPAMQTSGVDGRNRHYWSGRCGKQSLENHAVTRIGNETEKKFTTLQDKLKAKERSSFERNSMDTISNGENTNNERQ